MAVPTSKQWQKREDQAGAQNVSNHSTEVIKPEETVAVSIVTWKWILILVTKKSTQMHS